MPRQWQIAENARTRRGGGLKGWRYMVFSDAGASGFEGFEDRSCRLSR